MGVDDLERGVAVVEREEVAHLETQVGEPGTRRQGLGLRHDLRRRIEAHHLTRCDGTGKIDGDRPRTAPDIEERGAGAKVGKQVRRGVPRRAPEMAPQHRLVVPVRVGHEYIVTRCRSYPKSKPWPNDCTPSCPVVRWRGPRSSASPRSRRGAPRSRSSTATSCARSGAGGSTWCGSSPVGSRIVLHLSQAGRVDVEVPAKTTRPRGAVARFVFSDADQGTRAVLVREHGTQRKAAWWVLPPGDDGPLAGLGPEPDSPAWAELIRTSTSSRRLHTDLRDQRVMAGIGRGWGDDILHHARLSPFGSLGSLGCGGAGAAARRDGVGARGGSRPRAGPNRGAVGGQAGWTVRRARKVRGTLPDPGVPRRATPGLVRLLRDDLLRDVSDRWKGVGRQAPVPVAQVRELQTRALGAGARQTWRTMVTTLP